MSRHDLSFRRYDGVPFASAHALYGLSKLAVWWLRLGIQIERITPGHPQQNGRHERMHLTLKREATKPAAANVLQQQARFDDFLTRFNTDRPHQALGMKVPPDLYARSPRVYRGLEELTYPFHDQTIMVTGCGRICFRGRKVNLSHVFAGQSVGVTQVGERIWLVTFMQYDLGYFDDETCRLEPIENPFGPKVLGEFNPSTQHHMRLEAVWVCVGAGWRGPSAMSCGGGGGGASRCDKSRRGCGAPPASCTRWSRPKVALRLALVADPAWR